MKQLRVGAPLMFFDERTDPGGCTNLIRGNGPAGGDHFQDHAFREEIERLAKLLQDHMQITGDPQTEAFEKALGAWRVRAK